MDFSGASFRWQEPATLNDSEGFINALENPATRGSLLKASSALGKRNIANNIGYLIDNMKKYADIIKGKRNVCYRKCMLPWFGSFIDVHGKTYPCCKFIFTKEEERPLGVYDFSSSRFTTLYNNDKYSDFRSEIRQGKIYNGICNSCLPLTPFSALSRCLKEFTGAAF